MRAARECEGEQGAKSDGDSTSNLHGPTPSPTVRHSLDAKPDPIWGTPQTIGGRPLGGQRGVNATAFDVGNLSAQLPYFQTAFREPKMTA